jgi:hypothetical protein
MAGRTTTNIKWNDDWILKNKDKYDSISEMHKAYTTEVDSNVLCQSFRTHVRRKLSITSGLTWTQEERQWLIENFPLHGGLKCVDPFYAQFKKHRTHRAIEAEARRLKLYVNEDVVIENRNYTRRVPIGTIVDDGDGYLKIKTGKGSSGWERLHRHIYEKYNGQIPDGHKIVFLDGDKRNYNTDNMVTVPASYLALMNNLKMKSSNPQVTSTGIIWCELYEELKRQNALIETELN